MGKEEEKKGSDKTDHKARSDFWKDLRRQTGGDNNRPLARSDVYVLPKPKPKGK